RRLAAPGILAGAATTAAVFLGLTLCSMPGMAEMGLLVALGVLSGLVVMIGLMPVICAGSPVPQDRIIQAPYSGLVSHRLAAAATGLLVGGVGGVLALLGAPEMERKVDALRPRNSEAMAAFQWVQERLGRSAEASVPVLLTGPMTEMKARAVALEARLKDAVQKGILVRQAVPLPLVFDAGAQRANQAAIEWLLGERARLEAAIGEAGFADAALGLLRGLCAVWEKIPAWPQMPADSAAVPVLGRILSAADGVNGLPEGGGILLSSVSVPGMPGHPDRAKLEELRVHLLPQEGSFVAGWEMLSTTLSRLAQADLAVLLPPVVLLLLVTLFIVFRNLRDVLLSVLSLCAGVAALMATMSLLGQSWNLASLAAIPLLLGTGIDYSIHILLALRRTGNDIRLVRATTGRAVFFAGMTTVIGFSSLVFANNRGLSALGLACCAGVLWVLLIVLWLMPHWRAWLVKSGAASGLAESSSAK
ncbi:MAG TPA: MMPL family transporter, partial [Prosthecobacter sp.]|nr:MMPL family transporter [Prosthecobacter sp.]